MILEKIKKSDMLIYHLKLVQYKTCILSLLKIKAKMKFDDISGDGRLWAVRYDDDEDNILCQSSSQIIRKT